MTAQPVDLFFDPHCEFTWRTSRWLTEVERGERASITWRVMSLGILNEDKEMPEQFRPLLARSARALRALVAAEESSGNAAVGKLYAAIGRRVHDDGQDMIDEVIADAVREVGLPDSVAAAVDDENWESTVRTSHQESQTAVGDAAGSPVLRIDGRGFFGPVVAPVPTGDDAFRLFEGVRMLAGVNAFSELKTSRNAI